MTKKQGLLSFSFLFQTQLKPMNQMALALFLLILPLSPIQAKDFSALEKYLFQNTNLRTHTLLVYQNGEVQLERSDPPFRPDQKYRLWSMTKSVFNLLWGIVLEQKKISVNTPVHRFLPSFGHSKITLRHLLQMTSGIEWTESYSNPLASDVVAMLYGSGNQDMSGFVQTLSLKFQPGSHFQYSSGDTNLLAGAFRAVLGKEWKGFEEKSLFHPLGIQDYTWERDHQGNWVASSYLYLKPHDLLKIGMLVLQNGVFEGKRLFSEEWMKWSAAVSPGYPKAHQGDHLGAHWWTNQPAPKKEIPSSWPDGPKDAIAALGFRGQVLFIVPSLKLIAIRFASDAKDEMIDLNHFLKLLTETFS